MIEGLEDALPPAVTRATLYRIAGWLLRLYVAGCLLLGSYSLLWVLEVGGVLPDRWLSTAWIGIAGLGSVFLAFAIPLFYLARGADG
ncbi:hypothetical protein C478_15552 [Natrinema thermotolerans DSM 11552]|nr:hypothetical protein C478_15552 [Natrinema thermotolerans DSM 11552]